MITEHHGFAEACKRVPQGVICLLSSLVFHNITTQMPSQIWMAIPSGSRRPKATLPVRFVFFSGEPLRQGIEEHVIEGVKVRVYNPAKTIVDCFRYRNKIGRDVAIEAMRDALGKNLCSFSDVWHYAPICRMTKIIMPYMEAMP